METTTSHSAVLLFRSNTNEVIRITIPRARVAIPEAEARATMEAIIDGNAIVTDFGRPASVKAMEIVTTHRAPLV